MFEGNVAIMNVHNSQVYFYENLRNSLQKINQNYIYCLYSNVNATNITTERKKKVFFMGNSVWL